MSRLTNYLNMKTLERFSKFKLPVDQERKIKGGDTCSNCIHSAFIACDYSCGGGACSVTQCVQNQTAQCMAQSYCQ